MIILIIILAGQCEEQKTQYRPRSYPPDIPCTQEGLRQISDPSPHTNHKQMPNGSCLCRYQLWSYGGCCCCCRGGEAVAGVAPAAVFSLQPSFSGGRDPSSLELRTVWKEDG
jgi:hypothetical protein